MTRRTTTSRVNPYDPPKSPPEPQRRRSLLSAIPAIIVIIALYGLTLLVVAIPRVVKNARLAEPVYCLRIWYNGRGSDETAVPWLMLVKESTRQSFIRKHGVQAASYIWSADEATEPGQSFKLDIDSDELAELYEHWYTHLCDLEDDEELQPFREMTQRVASMLNTLDWSGITQVTHDFVVFPADGSHTFCDDIGDLESSIPKERLKLLKSRKLLELPG